MLKPPLHAKIAIIEFEDLECPMCASVSPLVRSAMKKYNIPRVHHDFIIQSHTWSRPAAVFARYLEDKVSPETAEDYRAAVFANQRSISSVDDLVGYTRGWFEAHRQHLPFVIDPSGRFAAEVQADCTLGERLGLLHTPTIVVVSQRGWIEVTDPSYLFTALDRVQHEATSSNQAASKKTQN